MNDRTIDDQAIERAVAGFRDAIAARRKSSIAEFTREVSAWVAYTLLFETKHKISHSADPPWDHSGSAWDTGQPYKLADYESLGAFLEEYTGESTATFESRRGLSWSTFSDELDAMATEAASDWLLSALLALRDIAPESFALFLALAQTEDAVMCDEETQESGREAAIVCVLSNGCQYAAVCDVFDCLPFIIELEDAVRDADLAELLAAGHESAEKRRCIEIENINQAQVRTASQRERVEMVVADLVAACPKVLAHYKRRSERRIGKQDQIWNMIKQSIAGWSPDRKRLLAESGLFSDSISDMLYEGRSE